jgi:hypothetical protein
VLVVQLEELLNIPHWSSDLPLETPHPRLAVLAERGYVELTDHDPPVPDEEFLSLEYLDWKSGGDTHFAPIATADGELDCAGFWKPGDERPDKDGRLTANAQGCPTLVRHLQSIGANFGRVRVIRLEPASYEESLRSLHRDDNNRFNPDDEGWMVRQWIELTDNPGAFMVLMEQGDDGLPDRDTEVHVPLHRGARFVVDSQRLWHVVCNPSPTVRYALISCLESGAALDDWIHANSPGSSNA